MMEKERWLLPEGIEELLPVQAARLERLQRQLLDMYVGWGYELVMPPFIEFTDSLLIGTGHDLDLRTFKLIDQMTGRLMGVRADMTPQVARIDAHLLKREVPTRLCYMGTVLQTRPQGHGSSRSPLQAGVELYGHAGTESDLEVLKLMVATLQKAGLEQVHLDLGHVAIFRDLAREAGLGAETESELFDALQRKAIPEIEALLSRLGIDAGPRAMLSALASLNGDRSVLELARKQLATAGPVVGQALDQLVAIADQLALLPGVSLHIDLAELRGYHYHTGVVFDAFIAGQGQSIAQGGRYDDIGKVFGRARPATGFSTDLKALLAYSSANLPEIHGIFAPNMVDRDLDQRIDALRVHGERVVVELPGQQGDAAAMGCDRILKQVAGKWQVVEV